MILDKIKQNIAQIAPIAINILWAFFICSIIFILSYKIAATYSTNLIFFNFYSYLFFIPVILLIILLAINSTKSIQLPSKFEKILSIIKNTTYKHQKLIKNISIKIILLLLLANLYINTVNHNLPQTNLISIYKSIEGYIIFLLLLLLFFLMINSNAKDEKETSKDYNWLYIFILIFITLLAAFLRLYQLGKLGFIVDEIYNGIAMKGIAENGLPTLPDGNLYTRGILVSWLASFIYKITNNPEFSLRLISAISSLAIIPYLYYFGKKISNRWIGLTAAIVWCFLPWSIEFARWGRMYGLMALITTMFFYYLYLFEKEKKKKFFIISLVTIFLGILTHQLTYFLVGCLFIYLLIKIIDNKKGIKKWFFLALSPPFLFFSFFLLIHAKSLISHTPKSFFYPTQLIPGYFEKLKNFNIFFVNYLKEDIIILYLGILIFVVFLLYSIINKKEKSHYLLLTLASWGGIIFVAFFNLQTTSRYLFPFVPIIVLIFCFTFFKTYKLLVKNVFPGMIWLTFIVFIIIFLRFDLSIKIPFREYGETYSNLSFAPSHNTDSYPNYKDTAIYIKNNANFEKDLIITDKFQFFYFYTEQEADYWYRPANEISFVKDEQTLVVKYCLKTRQIYNNQDLFEVIRNSEKNNIWITLNINRNDGIISDNTKTAIKELDYLYNLELMYQDPYDFWARVYKITK